ncbi:metalloendoproteinase 1 [Phtheirospermum japonicum]|uniref:Metalloendoproteinase 1 n=1 Tax=Phtheirospermum japonicum TaxID=374723 RepID=A0A830CVS7_9LAMI|nr:metalloendoproteinase 1 [Phtheirospermum japonicum]
MINYNNANPTHENHDDLFDDALESAITNYQNFFKLTVTGFLDADTANQLGRPRCGVPDNGIRSPKWPPEKRNLTYSFPPGERTDANSSTLDATDMWASVSNFRFSYIEDYNQADIKIAFLRRDHGDGNPFDGPKGILAHAFGPPDGRLHFDEDEDWVYGTVKDEFDILTVGLHELGHVLGLGHSTDDGAIMWPYVGSGERKGLGKDDKNGIRALYS